MLGFASLTTSLRAAALVILNEVKDLGAESAIRAIPTISLALENPASNE